MKPQVSQIEETMYTPIPHPRIVLGLKQVVALLLFLTHISAQQVSNVMISRISFFLLFIL